MKRFYTPQTHHSSSLTRIEIVPQGGYNCPPITFDIPNNFVGLFTSGYKVQEVSRNCSKSYYDNCKEKMEKFKQTQKELKSVQGEPHKYYEGSSEPIKKQLVELVGKCKYELEELKVKVTAVLKVCESGKAYHRVQDVPEKRLEENCIKVLDEYKWVDKWIKMDEDCNFELTGENAFALADFTDCFKYDMT